MSAQLDNCLNILEKIICALFIIVLIIFFVFPILIFQDNIIVNIHDNLDSVNAWFEMFHQNNLFFNFNNTPCFDGLNSAYYGFINFSMQSFIFALFNGFIGYSVNYILAVIIGIFSMFLFLQYLLPNMKFSNILCSVIFGFLPVIPSYGICLASIPFIFLILIKQFNCNISTKLSLALLFIFPFFSSLVTPGIFLIFIDLLMNIVYFLKYKKINSTMLLGLFVLILGYIIIDFKLIYSAFILSDPLNRSIIQITPSPIYPIFKSYLISGYYHAPTMQNKIILPVTLLVLFLSIFNKKNILSRKVCLIISFSLFSILVFSFIAALHDSGKISSLLNLIFPFLTGFNWGRFWMLNRFFWYLCFATSIGYLYSFSNILIKLISITFATFQIIYIMFLPNGYAVYNTAMVTWINELLLKPKIVSIDSLPSIYKQDTNEYISYKEFYSVDLFSDIKRDINYSGENVVALGYHPSVLMYNGFSCIDGYINSYPLEYMHRFRKIIAPELDINEEARKYYDGWGGRLYLYNKDLPYKPTRSFINKPVNVNIDPYVLKNDFKVKYIMSRARISNENDLFLDFKKVYTLDKSIYQIFLYEVI